MKRKEIHQKKNTRHAWPDGQGKLPIIKSLLSGGGGENAKGE